MSFKYRTITLAIAAALAAGAPAAFAQTQPSRTPETPAPAPEAQAPAANFPDEKLKSFAVAFVEVDRINKEYTPRLQGAKPEEQQTLRDEAGAKMVEAVEKTDGITPAEYNEIMSAAQVNPDLAQKVMTHVREASGDSGGEAPAQ